MSINHNQLPVTRKDALPAPHCTTFLVHIIC